MEKQIFTLHYAFVLPFQMYLMSDIIYCNVEKFTFHSVIMIMNALYINDIIICTIVHYV